MIDQLNRFQSVWSIDFEFSQPAGHRPVVGCLVGREFHSRRLIRLDQNQLRQCADPPFDVGPKSLFVAYYSSAEWNCFLSLGWKLPERVLDLFTEFRVLHNGRRPNSGYGLLSCLQHYGLKSLTDTEKEAMRELAIRGGPYTDDEIASLLDYCQSDVDALDCLLPVMMPLIDLPRALYRGRYMVSAARMETAGVPIDCCTLAMFRRQWSCIKDDLVSSIDQSFDVYDGGRFRQDKFARYLTRNRIAWPTTERGQLKLDDKTFREQVKIHPSLSPLREIRHAMNELKLEKLDVGPDGRNRVMLSAFASKTGRNQPSNNKFVFGPSAWLRGLIQPPPGRAIAYVDWAQQELGIAAALSGDAALLRAYASGDPYLEFAKMAGAVPSTATKSSHAHERSAYKVCMLATQYGQSEYGLATKLSQPVAFARNLLRRHRETFPTFWKWSQQQVDSAMLGGQLQTVFGWTLHTIGGDNPRSLANFPMQANGAEMMRLACCLATEAGITVCCPVHDAILIESDVATIEDAVLATQQHMKEASRIVLDGFALESDAKIIRYPQRYMDEDRGRVMWDRVLCLATEADRRSSFLVA